MEGKKENLKKKLSPGEFLRFFSSLLMSTSELRKNGDFFRIGVNKKGGKIKINTKKAKKAERRSHFHT